MSLIFRLLSLLPLPVLHGLGALFGWLALLRPRHAALLRENLDKAGLRDQVSLMAVGAGLGQCFMELAAIWLRPLVTVTGWVREVEGLEHLHAAHAAGRGVVLLCPHQACWEIAGIWYGAQFPMTALYRPPKQAWAHQMMKAGRERGHIVTVPPDRSGVKALLAALKRGETAFILPDQVANRGEGVWAPFLSQQVYLPSLPYRLAGSTGAAMLLIVCERLNWGRGYRLRIENLAVLPAAAELVAERVHQRIEGHIRQQPAHYLWSYRLFRRHRDTSSPPDNLLEAAA